MCFYPKLFIAICVNIIAFLIIRGICNVNLEISGFWTSGILILLVFMNGNIFILLILQIGVDDIV